VLASVVWPICRIQTIKFSVYTEEHPPLPLEKLLRRGGASSIPIQISDAGGGAGYYPLPLEPLIMVWRAPGVTGLLPEYGLNQVCGWLSIFWGGELVIDSYINVRTSIWSSLTPPLYRTHPLMLEKSCSDD